MVYNIIMERVIKSVFTNEELDQIKMTIENELSERLLADWETEDEIHHINYLDKYKIHPAMGRLLVENISTFPHHIMEKIKSVAYDFDNSLRYLSATYCEYSGAYGTPNLNMHKDRGTGENVCLDLQLESNIKWDLIINGETYSHEDSDIIIFKTTEEEHGRPQIDFSANDFVKVIFFYFERVNQDEVR